MKKGNSESTLNLSSIRIPVLSIALALCALFVSPALSQVTLRTETSSVGRLDLVVHDFIADGDSAFLADLPSQLRGFVKGDLAYSGYFNLIEPSDLPPDTSIQVKRVGTTFDTLVTFTGAQAARVRGSVSLRWEQATVSISLFQPPLREPTHVQDFSFQPDHARDAAHDIAAWITRMLTGEEGSFTSKIAFVVRTAQNKDLWIMDWDGANAHSLTRDQTLNMSPTWTPDGNALYFTTFREGTADVYRYEIASGRARPFVATPKTDSAPSVSFDGQWVAYASSENGNFEIYRAHADGSGKTQLTFSNRDDTSPSWSPTGRELVFTSDRGGSPQIYQVDFDGVDVRRLSFNGIYNETARWSPRGDLIVFCSRESQAFPKFQIFTIQPGGQRERRLTDGGNKFDPSWSPDGMKIVYTSSEQGKSSIWTCNWDGSNHRQLTFGIEASQPQWGPILPLTRP
ncbi:PD40 domain-containing protein [bacterium]|nr:PD40 domain-containing protein [bacterium]